ncbi:hypothetical protein SAMN05660690_4229 [Geodermatophilus telluris]|uniref:Uncharacterized protein n=1 Tax=Geodermatophilus telluris TaxID=1190417 RepID=A0A1G6UJB5_9ACTN|nr:hypothetical protein [Geodermatophilus telluris]SDD40657.1 hypothetical protein SAMN05660690_4229 [Geodermatophilus telluris]
MTGPDDAFLAPDDALREFDDVTDLPAGTDGGRRSGEEGAGRPDPTGAAVEDAGRSAGPPEGGTGS